MTLPRIAVVATGGTIAGSAASATDATGYRAGTTPVADMLASVPELADVAELIPHQFAQLDSSEMTDAIQLDLARFVRDLLPDVDGVVVTHGTDSLEESAYLLHLTLDTTKPVVFTGAIRPATALAADGPRNLFDAVSVASRAPSDLGVLVVLDGEVHSARDVTKVAVDRFASPYGPLGTVVNGRLSLYRLPSRAHGGLPIPDELPWSDISVIHPRSRQVNTAPVTIVATYGNGTIPSHVMPLLDALRDRGSVVVRASRTGSGTLTSVGASADASVNDWLVVDDQSPLRARILTALAVASGATEPEIQELFYRY